ncbi:MAG: C-type lectin domain-containing protein, partial [Pseudomonadota bacterium]
SASDALCTADGYDLVAIDDLAENDFVFANAIASDANKTWWIGYADLQRWPGRNWSGAHRP